MNPTVDPSAAEREPDSVTPEPCMSAAEAAELRTLFAGNLIVDHAEAALRSFGVVDGDPADAVKLLLAWPDFDELTEREVRGVAARFVPVPVSDWSAYAECRNCAAVAGQQCNYPGYPDMPLDAPHPNRLPLADPAYGDPCDRTDLPELADMMCAGCGTPAGDHPAWLRKHPRKVIEPDGLTPQQIEDDRVASELDSADDHFHIGPTSSGWPGTDLAPATGPRHYAEPGAAVTRCGVALDEVPLGLLAGDLLFVDCPECAGKLVDEQLAEPVRVIEAQVLRDLEAATRDGQPITVAPGVEAEPERRTVSLEVLTDELHDVPMDYEQETGATNYPPNEARIGVVVRYADKPVQVTDVDSEWQRDKRSYTAADVLGLMLLRARFVADDHAAELLMPTPDVLAALDGRPDAQLLTAPVHVLAMDVDPGMYLAPLDGPLHLVTETAVKCTTAGCEEGDSCVVFLVDGREQHGSGYARTRVRIPVSVTL